MAKIPVCSCSPSSDPIEGQEGISVNMFLGVEAFLQMAVTLEGTPGLTVPSVTHLVSQCSLNIHCVPGPEQVDGAPPI